MKDHPFPFTFMSAAGYDPRFEETREHRHTPREVMTMLAEGRRYIICERMRKRV